MDCWQSYDKRLTELYWIVDRAYKNLFPKHNFVYLQKQILVYLQKHTFVKRLFFENVRQSKQHRLLTELWETVRLHETKFFLRARINCWRSYIDTTKLYCYDEAKSLFQQIIVSIHHWFNKSFFQPVVVSTNPCFNKSLFRQIIVSAYHCFNKSLFQQIIVSTYPCFNKSLFRQIIVSTSHCFNQSLFQHILLPRNHCYNKSLFLKFAASQVCSPTLDTRGVHGEKFVCLRISWYRRDEVHHCAGGWRLRGILTWSIER